MKKSAGLLMYRRGAEGALQVLLAHPGGPYWSRKDKGAWTLPKGEFEPTEEPLAAARREFLEETGFEPTLPFISLGGIVQKSGKHITAWAFAGDCDPGDLRSNRFELEWPPGSGRRESFPEIDRVAWFTLNEARLKLNPAQSALLDRLERAVGGNRA